MQSKNYSLYYLVTAGLWALYVVLTFLSPLQANNRYNLSTLQSQLLRISIMLPILVIWLVLVYGLVQLKRYADSIEGSTEHRYYNYIVWGLWALALGLILPSFISFISAFQPGIFEAKKFVSIVNRYINIATLLVAFSYILMGSKGLLSLLPNHQSFIKNKKIIAYVVVIALFAGYSFLLFNNPYRTSSPDPLISPTYYLPDPLIIITVMIPYLIVWIIGSGVIINIMTFSQNVTGQIYRKAFYFIALGLITITTLSIGLQLLAQATVYFSKASLGAILIIVYALLILIAIGYGFIARGAKELVKIENI